MSWWYRLCWAGWLGVTLIVQVGCGKGACSYVCEPLQRRCISEGLLVCSKNVTSGCYDWSLIPCLAGESCMRQGSTYACVNGSTNNNNSNNNNNNTNCEPKQSRKDCVGNKIHWFDSCGQRGELVLTCSQGFVCKNAQCSPGRAEDCGDENLTCARGERRCAGKLVQDCVWNSQKNCGSWGSPSDCGGGRSCRDGYCKADGAGCLNSCKVGSKRCVGVAVQVCETNASSSCGQWGSITQCPSGQMCVNDSCLKLPANCPNSCVVGAQRCGPSQSVEKCQVVSGQCPVWQVDRKCPNDLVCKNGKCVSQCPQECQDNQQRCVGNEVQQCKRSGSCTAWELRYRCGALQLCKQQGQSYFCDCQPGYTMSSDGKTCVKTGTNGNNCQMNPEEKRVLELVNQERSKQGVSPLYCHVNLVSVSRSWSQAQCDRGYIGHDGFRSRISSLSLRYGTAGENVAAGQAKPEDVVRAWMKSPGHRKNILNAAFTHLGNGYVKCSKKGYVHYWTQIFIQMK